MFQVPLPLAVRNNTSDLHKQRDAIVEGNKAHALSDSQNMAEHQNGGHIEAKVMRRDILSNYEKIYKPNTNQYGAEIDSGFITAIKNEHKDILSDIITKNELAGDNVSLERQKRDTQLDESTITDKDENEHVIQGVAEKCEVGEKSVSAVSNEKHVTDDKKHEFAPSMSDKYIASTQIHVIQGVPEKSEVGENSVSASETLKMAAVSNEKHEFAPSLSDKYIASTQISILGSVPHKMADIIKSETSSVSPADINISGNRKHESFVSGKIEKQADSEVKRVSVRDISTSSSVIRTPSHLSEPKLGDGVMILNDAVMNARDISVVAKPMTRDLKSVQRVYENHELDETKDI
jgi:hypothetical protein